MSRASINFKLLAEHLNPHNASLITSVVSGGSLKGHEYSAASIYGGKGDSFKFNILTGKWADFAQPDHCGGDIISLYAMVHNVSQLEAAKYFAEITNFNFSAQESVAEKLPNMISAQYGPPSGFWVYRNKRGLPTCLVIRYDPEDQKKQFSQWHFSQVDNKWIPKALPENRPLYKLDVIDANKTKTIVLCEGEKAAEAAQELLGDSFIATCWLGGSNAISKTDFSPLYGRNVILWPDNDDPGKECMAKISKKIISRTSSLAFIDPKPEDEPKFDAYDLLQQAPTTEKIDEYIKTRTRYVKRISSPAVDKPEPGISPVSSKPISAVGESLTVFPEIYDEDQQELEILRDSHMIEKWNKIGLIMKSETKPYLNEQNVIRILNSSDNLSSSIYYDEFHKKYMSSFGYPAPVPFSDVVHTKFKIYLQEKYGFGDISTSTIKESMRYYASQTIKNSVADYIKSLEWDGQPRIDAFMHVIYGAENSEYNTAASRIFWLSMVARILEPAVKADIMIILEGDQGIQKSASLEEIGSLMNHNFYSVSGKRMDNKDFYIGLSGKYIVEMGEINALLKNSDEDIKEMLSTRYDNYRIPYASEATDNPRTNIFVGTTNQENYLRDETGARRFLPVKCKKVDMELLKETKLQLFAEAVHRKLQGENHWVFPKELAKEETDKRMEMDDIWSDTVLDYCMVNHYRYVKISDVATDALGLGHDRQDQRTLNRVSKILKKAGFVKVQIIDNGRRSWVFENPAETSAKKSWIDRPFLHT